MTDPHSYRVSREMALASVLDEIEEFLEGQQDVRDGSDGPLPNRAMQLLSALAVARTEWARATLKRREGSITVEVFRSGDNRVFANVNQSGVQLAHLKAGESFTIQAGHARSCGPDDDARDAARYRRIRQSPAWYDAHGRKLWGEELDAAVDASCDATHEIGRTNG